MATKKVVKAPRKKKPSKKKTAKKKASTRAPRRSSRKITTKEQVATRNGCVSARLDPSLHKKLLTPSITNYIARLVRQGNYIEVAAACAGVSRLVVFQWLRKGSRAQRDFIEKGTEIPSDALPYVEFARVVLAAQAESESDAVKILEKLSKKNLHALTWRLERRFAQRWSKADRHFMTDESDEGSSFKLKLSLINDDDEDTDEFEDPDEN